MENIFEEIIFQETISANSSSFDITIEMIEYQQFEDLIFIYKIFEIPTVINGINLENVNKYSGNAVCQVSDEYLTFCEPINKLLKLPFKFTCTNFISIPCGFTFFQAVFNEIFFKKILIVDENYLNQLR